MVEIGSQKMQNVASSHCRSLGSNQYPSGWFPKVSIGITVEKCQKMGSKVRKEDATALPAGGRASSHQGTQETTRTANVETLEGKRSEAEDQKASAWFSSTRSVCLETPTAETVQFCVNQASVLQSEDGVHKKLDTVAYGKRREKGGIIERVEEVAFATMQETQLLHKGIGKEEPEKLAKCNNEALRIKLWEILGTAPSQNKHTTNAPNLEESKNANINQSRENQKGKVARTKLNSPNLEKNKEDLYINQSKEYQKGKVSKPNQNSDTIETDSESPNQAMRRPITRSLTRKPPKTVHKLQGNISYRKKPLSSSSSDFKLKLEKRNIFAFDEVEGKAGSLGRTASGHSNRSKEKIKEQKKAKIEPRRIYFPRLVSEKSLQNNDTEQTLLSPDKASPQSKEKGCSPSLPCQGKKQLLQTSNDVRNNSHHSQRDVQNHFGSPPLAHYAETWENTDSPLIKMGTHSWGHESSPSVPKNAFLHETVACPSAVRKTDALDDFQSPTLAMDMSPTLPSMPPSEVLCSPVLAQPSKLTRKIYSSKDLDNSGPGSCESDASTESLGDTREIHKSRDMESLHVKEEETKQLSLSPVEEQDTESFEADDFTSQGFGQTDKWFSNAGSPKKSPFTLHHTKRVHSLNDVKLRKANLPSSPIGTSRTEEITGSLEVLEQYPENSLARSVAQLALVLERFRTRMKSQTSKKCSEILSAAADKIRLQLQDVESQILADVGKFTSIGKSKRKRLESRFQEQQERLRLIHDKFKREVNQHLLDCRSTLEELEAHHMELKGSADRQKASHRKLLLQVEEAMEAQINDAETSIAAIHKEARKKMNGLKRALKECME